MLSLFRFDNGSILLAHQIQEESVDATVVGDLGVERRRHQVSLPYGDSGCSPRPRASTSTSEPTSSTHGARMKTACTGWSSPSRSSRPRTSRPAARTRCAARSCRSRRSSPGRRRRRGSGRRAGSSRAGAEGRHARPHPLPQRLEQVEGVRQLGHRGRLAARQHQPVAPGQLGGTAYRERVAPSAVSVARCSRTSPWRANTPTAGTRRGYVRPVRSARAEPVAAAADQSEVVGRVRSRLISTSCPRPPTTQICPDPVGMPAVEVHVRRFFATSAVRSGTAVGSVGCRPATRTSRDRSLAARRSTTA